MSKVTLSVDEDVVRQAKRYAERRGTSVSRLVQSFLKPVSSRPEEIEEAPPALKRLRGSLKGARASGYRRHLSDKYR